LFQLAAVVGHLIVVSWANVDQTFSTNILNGYLIKLKINFNIILNKQKQIFKDIQTVYFYLEEVVKY
jgi:hypothetical protein